MKRYTILFCIVAMVFSMTLSEAAEKPAGQIIVVVSVDAEKGTFVVEKTFGISAYSKAYQDFITNALKDPTYVPGKKRTAKELKSSKPTTIGTLYFTQSSPGCVWVPMPDGSYYQYCS
jgi:hypothetical protein